MQPHTLNVFATRLKLARQAKKISQERLGILAGIDPSSASARMNQYERGKHIPDFLMVSQIAKVLELPTAYFYVDDDLLAEIIQRSYLLNEQDKTAIIQFIDELKTQSSTE